MDVSIKATVIACRPTVNAIITAESIGLGLLLTIMPVVGCLLA